MKTIILIHIFLGGVLIASSQPFPPEDLSTPSQHHFSVYPVGIANWDNIYFQPRPDQFQQIEFRAYERSNIYSYRGEFPLVFFQKILFETGKEEYQPIARVFPRSSTTHHLCVFTPISTNRTLNQPLKFQVIAINDNANDFPIGTLTFLNATGVKLNGYLGKEPVVLTKGISTPFSLQLERDLPTLIKLEIATGKQPRKVMENQWYLNTNYRELVILLPPRDVNSYRIQAFRISQHKDEIYNRKLIQQPGQGEQ